MAVASKFPDQREGTRNEDNPASSQRKEPAQDPAAAYLSAPRPVALLRITGKAVRTALLILLILPLTAGATVWQPLDDIREAAESFARSKQPGSARDYRAGALDDRLKLKACDAALEAFLPPGSRPGNNLTVGVRCAGSAPWKVFVPVRSTLTGHVLVSRKPLPRGHRIGPGDLASLETNLDRLPYGYFTDPALATGQVLKRPVAAGAVIIPPMLGRARTVRRGQTVTLVASDPGIRIQAPGRALMDGAVQQRIRVENLSSGRVVEGIVRSAEQVEVLMR